MVEFDPEHRLRDGPNVADGLLGGLAVVSEDVDLHWPADPVTDDPDPEDSREAAELVLGLPQVQDVVGLPAAARGGISRPLVAHPHSIVPGPAQRLIRHSIRRSDHAAWVSLWPVLSPVYQC